jgi:hypothetical protein
VLRGLRDQQLRGLAGEALAQLLSNDDCRTSLCRHGTEVLITFSRFNTDGNWFTGDSSSVIRTQKVSAK